ncbi:MAG: RNA polymerase sigma factor SigF [Chloroflexaceae bacterium]|nr:RNA polymerase sigma factor SigF [Chloroflexaceae bacterium]
MNTQRLSYQGLEMLLEYDRQPSLELRNRIVELNAGLVRKVAHCLSQQCAEPYDDLEQIGYLGLIRAIERYNPRQGAAFSSFAIPYIRGEILHYLRDKSSTMRIPRRWQDLYAKGKKLRKELSASLGRSPRDGELAKALNVSPQEWSECQLACQNRMLVSLDAIAMQTPDCAIALGDTLADPRCQLQRKWEDERLQLQGAMNQLDEKTKAAIEYVYLRDLPRREAAKQIGVSPMTVTRHLHKGIKQLGILLQPQVA